MWGWTSCQNPALTCQVTDHKPWPILCYLWQVTKIASPLWKVLFVPYAHWPPTIWQALLSRPQEATRLCAHTDPEAPCPSSVHSACSGGNQGGEAPRQASTLGSRQNKGEDSRKETGAWGGGVRDDQAQLVESGAVSGWDHGHSLSDSEPQMPQRHTGLQAWAGAVSGAEEVSGKGWSDHRV